MLLSGGSITSMDLADRLSRLPKEDQYPVATGVVSGELDAHDVRAILGLRLAIFAPEFVIYVLDNA